MRYAGLAIMAALLVAAAAVAGCSRFAATHTDVGQQSPQANWQPCFVGWSASKDQWQPVSVLVSDGPVTLYAWYSSDSKSIKPIASAPAIAVTTRPRFFIRSLLHGWGRDYFKETVAFGPAPVAILTAAALCREYHPDLGDSAPAETARVTVVRSDLQSQIPRPEAGPVACHRNGITVSWREPGRLGFPLAVSEYRWRFPHRQGAATSGVTESATLTFAGDYRRLTLDFYVAADYGPAQSDETLILINCP